MDFIKEPGNLKLLSYHYGSGPRCGIVTDGTTFEPPYEPDSNDTVRRGPLAWMDPFELMTFLVPGLNGYYDTHITLDDWQTNLSVSAHLPWKEYVDDIDPAAYSRRQRKLIVWCGELFTLYNHMAQTSGTQITFRAFPAADSAVTELIMMPRVNMMMMLFFLASFESLPSALVHPLSFMSSVEYGQMICKKQYTRLEFVFLKSIDEWCWLGTVASIAMLTVVTAWITHNYQKLVDKQSARQIFASQTVFNKRANQPNNKIITVKFDASKATPMKRHNASFASLMLRHAFIFACLFFLESADLLDRVKPRLLVCVWLLAVTVVSNCITGSMRDLMRDAIQTVVPEKWEDFFTNPAFERQPFWTCTILPDYYALRDGFPHELAGNTSHAFGLLIVNLIDLGSLRNIGAQFGVFIYTAVGDLIFFTVNLLYLMFLWLLDMYRSFTENWMARNGHGIGGYADGKLTVDHFMDTVFNLHVSGPRSSHSLFMTGIYRALKRFEIYFNGLVERMRAAGFLDYMFREGEAKMMNRFFYRSPADEALAAGYAPVVMDDFQDPLILYGFTVLANCVILMCELIRSKVNQQKQ